MILVPVLLFFAVLAALSLWTERRRSLPLEETGGGAGFSREYFLGSRSLQGVVLAMTLTATYGSVSTFVSGPGIAWNLGLGWVVFAAPQIIAGFFILGLLGKKMALVSRAVGAVTVVDLLRARFRSPVFATLAALSMLVFFTTMMVGQFSGGAAIFAEVTGGSTIQGLLLFGLLTVFYTTFGGFRAVAVTDALCALLMVLGMVLLAVDIVSEAGGFAEAMRAAAAASPDAEAYLSFDAGGALPLSLLLSAWILVGFGTAGLPQSAVRCMSYRSTEDLHRAMWMSTVVCGALMIGMTLIGVLARGVFAVSPESLGTTDRMIPRLIAEHMSPVAAGITLIGPLAATMSTVSSLLIAASSAVVKDLLLNARPEWAAPGNERRLRFAAKGTTLVLGLAATRPSLGSNLRSSCRLRRGSSGGERTARGRLRERSWGWGSTGCSSFGSPISRAGTRLCPRSPFRSSHSWRAPSWDAPKRPNGCGTSSRTIPEIAGRNACQTPPVAVSIRLI